MEGFNALIWFLIGVGLMLLELALPGFVIFFFGIGAWAAAIASLAGLDNFNIQLILSLVVSILTLILFRKKGKKYFEGKISHRGISEEKLEDVIGEKAVTVTDINAKDLTGKVEFHGTNLNAESDVEIPKGTVVEIISRNNLVLKVKPII